MTALTALSCHWRIQGYRVKTSDISGIPTSRKDRILREEHEDQATTTVTTSIPTTTVAKQKQQQQNKKKKRRRKNVKGKKNALVVAGTELYLTDTLFSALGRTLYTFLNCTQRLRCDNTHKQLNVNEKNWRKNCVRVSERELQAGANWFASSGWLSCFCSRLHCNLIPFVAKMKSHTRSNTAKW